jgi:hypothetical protein
MRLVFRIGVARGIGSRESGRIVGMRRKADLHYGCMSCLRRRKVLVTCHALCATIDQLSTQNGSGRGSELHSLYYLS